MKNFIILISICALSVSLCDVQEKINSTGVKTAATDTGLNVNEDCSIVHITVGFGAKNSQQEEEMGWSNLSGFIIESEGKKWVLSAGHLVINKTANGHIFDNAKNIKKIIAYFKPGLRTPEELKLVGYDLRLDVSLLEFVNKNIKGLVPLKLGLSRRLRRGQKVFSLGHPSPLLWARTGGEINCIETFTNDQETQPELIIHDAIINQGSSGSPLFNSKKEVVGINVRLVVSTSNGLSWVLRPPSNIFSAAIPIDDVMFLLPALKEGGAVSHISNQIVFNYSNYYYESDLKTLGIDKRPVVEGLMIIKVGVGSDFEKLGFRPGDIVLSCNGKKPKSLADLYRAIYLKYDFTTPLTITVDRYGKKIFYNLVPRRD